MTLSPADAMPSLGLVLLFFAGFLIQGMSEELLCRSYLMVSLSRKWPLWACAVSNALLFSLLHVGNPGVTVIALVNIFLFGLFASMLTLRRGSIWMVGAVHSMWNFAQGNLFGIPVSGLAGSPSPLIAEMGEGSWKTLVNGGSFGLEGGLAVTAVLAVACVVVWFASTKKSEVVIEINE
jgi:membrane protease YdiL (CAAX protease family)